MRIVNRTFSLWFILVLVLLGGCGKPASPTPDSPAPGIRNEEPTPRLTTPEATLNAAKAEAAKHDYKAFCALLTPTAQEDMAAGLVMLSQFLQISSPKEKGDAARAEKLRAKVREVLDRHNLNEKTIPKIHIKGNASPEEQASQMRKLAAPIKDHAAFVAELLGVLHQYGDKPDGRLIEVDAKLADVKEDGKTATATFIQSRNGRESRGPIAFEKVNGEWKISKVPPWLN